MNISVWPELFGKPAAPRSYVGLCLPEHPGRIWTSSDCDCSDGAGYGDEHHTLACATALGNPAVCRGVLLRLEPDGEETTICGPLDHAVTHATLGQSAWRIFRWNRFAGNVCNWNGGRRTARRSKTQCVGPSATVSLDGPRVCAGQSRQSLWISLAPPHCTISWGIVLPTAHQ